MYGLEFGGRVQTRRIKHVESPKQYRITTLGKTGDYGEAPFVWIFKGSGLGV